MNNIVRNDIVCNHEVQHNSTKIRHIQRVVPINMIAKYLRVGLIVGYQNTSSLVIIHFVSICDRYRSSTTQIGRHSNPRPLSRSVNDVVADRRPRCPGIE